VARLGDLSVRNKKTAPFSTFTFLPVSERVELPLASALEVKVMAISLMCGMARRGGSPTVRGGVGLRHPSWSGYRHVPLAEDLAWLPPCSVG
jgi:hypothetical protein